MTEFLIWLDENKDSVNSINLRSIGGMGKADITMKD